MVLKMLDNPSLFRNQNYIDGQWLDADDGKTLAVFNPANNEKIGDIPNSGKHEAERAIASALNAWASWRDLSANERSAILFKWFDLIQKNQEDLAKLLTWEQGKPLAQARGEIAYGASYVQWYAEEAKRIYGQTIPAPASDKRILVLKQSVGVCAAITPWNFPNAMITRKIAPALAAGCTFVLRPASQTPFSALALAVLAEEAGIPKGVLNMITGDARAIGKVLTEDERVRKFSFTGSTEVGKQLMAQCASTIKKVSLELGGNAPFIVFDDADLDKAVAGAVLAKFRNAGQTCVCANRIYVQSGIYDAFVDKLTLAVSRLKVGDGFAEDSDLGALIDDIAVRKTQILLNDAVEKGGLIRTGGQANGRFFEPTVIANATHEMRLAKEEIFAPIAPIFVFETEEDAIALANETEYGLAAYFYSNQLSRVMRVSERLEYGMVGVNTGLISNAAAPFGGVKQSGLGREGSFYGLDEYLTIKYIAMDI